MKTSSEAPARAGHSALAFAGAMLLLHLGVMLAVFVGGKAPRPLHHTDEQQYHFPLIESYAKQGLNVAAEDYTTTTPPLFHLTFAGIHSLGIELWGLRAVNMLLASIGAALLFRMLLRRGGSATVAWLLASGFALAPYCIGRSMVLSTETSALLWLVASFSTFDRWHSMERPSRKWLLGSALFLTLAVLTRQHMIWLAAWFGVLTLGRPIDGLVAPRRRLVEATVWLLPGIAFLPFAITWQGVVPPAFQVVNQATEPNWRAMVFTLSTLGLYAALLGPGRLIAFVRRHPKLAAVTAAGATALCAFVGMRFVKQGVDDGYLWRISRAAPTVLGANLLLAGMTVIGFLELLRACLQGRRAYVAFVLLFTGSFVVIATNFQKYYESPLLLVLTWDLCRDRREIGEPTHMDLLGRMTFALLGGAYLVTRSI